MANRYDPTPRLRGRAWGAQRALLLAQQPLCVHCKALGRVRAATEIDHKVPLFKGGSHDADNLQPLCAECHDAKTRTDLGWRARPRVDVSGVPEGWI